MTANWLDTANNWNGVAPAAFGARQLQETAADVNPDTGGATGAFRNVLYGAIAGIVIGINLAAFAVCLAR
jgi:hypothetical protein